MSISVSVSIPARPSMQEHHELEIWVFLVSVLYRIETKRRPNSSFHTQLSPPPDSNSKTSPHLNINLNVCLNMKQNRVPNPSQVPEDHVHCVPSKAEARISGGGNLIGAFVRWRGYPIGHSRHCGEVCASCKALATLFNPSVTVLGIHAMSEVDVAGETLSIPACFCFWKCSMLMPLIHCPLGLS